MAKEFSLLILLAILFTTSAFRSRNLLLTVRTLDVTKSNQHRVLFLGSEFERTEPVKLQQAKVPVVEAEKTSETAKATEYEQGLSSSMKDKLRRELQSQGADPNYSAGPIKGNPILIISAVVAVLVLLGGKGFFF